ncbi:hypothetical protein, partial [Enterococcus faecium]|uniref:hypothetical protein n=1 Tax=Enterococcus faecium TaxID=1352 RepID=UPI002930C621
INNIAGFGGFVSVGLRSELYGQKKESRNVIQALSKVFLFLMAVLSIRVPENLLQFEGQTKEKLGTPVARTVVDNVISEQMGFY